MKKLFFYRFIFLCTMYILYLKKKIHSCNIHEVTKGVINRKYTVVDNIFVISIHVCIVRKGN